MTLDESNNIFIAGYFSGTVDFDAGTGTSIQTANCGSPNCREGFITKYTTNGDFVSVKRPPSNSTGYTYPHSIAYKNGKVYTVGSGGLLQVFNATDFDISNNNILPTASTYIFTNSINLQGPSWAADIDVDEQGSIYIAGYFNFQDNFGSGSSLDPANGKAFFLKLLQNSNNLALAWKQQIAESDRGKGIVLGKNNEVFGLSAKLVTDLKIHISKMDRNNGNFINSWGTNGIKTINNSYVNTALRSPMAVQPDNGDLLIALTSYNNQVIDFGDGVTVPTDGTSGVRLVMAEYQASGTCLWAKAAGRVSDDFYPNNLPVDLDVDSEHIYLAGWFVNLTNINVCDSTYTLQSIDSLSTFDGYVAKYGQVVPDLIYNFNPTIAGASNICNNNETYTATYYEGASYTWEVSNNVSIVSVNNNTITVTQNLSALNGQGWVKVTASKSNDCINYTSNKVVQKNIWLGKPQKPYIPHRNGMLPEPYVFRFPQSFCKNAFASIWVTSQGADFIASQLSDSTQQKIYKGGSMALLQIPLNQPIGTYVYQVIGWARRRQGCSSDITEITIIIEQNDEGEICPKEEEEKRMVKIYPNPVADVLQIEAEANCYILFNKLNQKVAEGVLSNKKGKINLQNLPQDIYFLHLHFADDIIERRQVIVSR